MRWRASRMAKRFASVARERGLPVRESETAGELLAQPHGVLGRQHERHSAARLRRRRLRRPRRARDRSWRRCPRDTGRGSRARRRTGNARPSLPPRTAESGRPSGPSSSSERPRASGRERARRARGSAGASREPLFFASERVVEAPPVREHCGAVYGRPDRRRGRLHLPENQPRLARVAELFAIRRGIASPQRGQCVRGGLDSSSVCQQRGHRNIRFGSGMSIATSAACFDFDFIFGVRRSENAKGVPASSMVHRLQNLWGMKADAAGSRHGIEAPSRSFRRPRVSAGSKPRSTDAGDAISTGMRPRGCSARGRGSLR